MAGRELANFIIDLNDEDCPDHSLHSAAYAGRTDELTQLLTDDAQLKLIDSRIRPFLATPLRLAATSGKLEAVEILLSHRASVDTVDVKSQTPLFVALVNQHWEIARRLLEAGADPNGADRNLCSPLSVMAQRGHEVGVRLLCSFGAETEDVYRLMTGSPSSSLPLTISTTYHHLRVFLVLLLFGAEPDSATMSSVLIKDGRVIDHCSVPHAIVRHRCPKAFAYIYHEFGGNLRIRDGLGRLATEIADKAPSLQLMKCLQGK